MLFEDGKPLRLGSWAMDILIALVEGAGETIHKDQLIAGTWPDTVVDEGALRVHVAALRKALGEGRARKRYIVNNPGRANTKAPGSAGRSSKPCPGAKESARTLPYEENSLRIRTGNFWAGAGNRIVRTGNFFTRVREARFWW